MAQCVAALIPVHRTSSLLTNVHRLFDPSGTSVRLPVQNCSFRAATVRKTYIGETVRKLGTRLKEHKTEVEATTKKPFTRSQRLQFVRTKQVGFDGPCQSGQSLD